MHFAAGLLEKEALKSRLGPQAALASGLAHLQIPCKFTATEDVPGRLFRLHAIGEMRPL
jgi:hypothetical protein